MTSVIHKPVLMIDRGFQAYDAMPVCDAFGKVIADRATFVDENYQQYDIVGWMGLSIDGYDTVATSRQLIRVPEIMRFAEHQRDHKRSVVMYNRKNLYKRDGYRCFIPDALVLMADYSMKKISEVEIGDQIIDAFGIVQKVEYVCSKYVDEDLISIRHRGNGDPLVCTNNHRILLSDQKFNFDWVEACRATIEDYCAEVDLFRCQQREVIDHVDLLEFTRNLRYVDSDEQYVWNKNASDNKVKRIVPCSSALGQLIGYFLAEGSTRQGKVVTFCFHIDEEQYVNDVRELIRNLFELKTTVKLNKDRHTSVVTCCSSVLASFFREWCYIGEKKRVIFVHHGRMCKNDYVNGVLYGIMRGDGNFNEDLSRATLMLGNESLIRDIYIASQIVGLRPTLSKTGVRKDGRVYKSIIYNANEYNRIRDICEISKLGYDKNGKIDRTFDSRFDFFLAKISKISTIKYRGLVYDLQIGGSHSYVVNFTCVHNCQYCSKRPRSDEITIDHILPQSRGGLSTFPNAVLCCLKCNLKKGNKTPEEAGMRLRRIVRGPCGTPQVKFYHRPIQPRWNPHYSLPKLREYPQTWKHFLQDKNDELYWDVELIP